MKPWLAQGNVILWGNVLNVHAKSGGCAFWRTADRLKRRRSASGFRRRIIGGLEGGAERRRQKAHPPLFATLTMPWWLTHLLVVCILFNGIAFSAFAEEEKGKLDAVEQEIESGKETNTSSSSTTSFSSTASASAGEIVAQSFLEVFFTALLAGMGQGMENSGQIYHELKSEWHPALPTVRVEPSYQWAAGGINAFSGKAEAGYLVFGMDGEFTRYFEKQPTDRLDVWSAHFLMRSLFARAFGFNVALGVKGVRGNKHRTGFDFGFPMYFFITKNVILDIQDTFALIKSTRIYDVGAGISYKWKCIGARAGYRALFVGDERLHGPRIGVFFQF